MLLPLLLIGCEPVVPKDSTPLDTGFVYRDTSPVIDSGEETAEETDPPDDTSTETATDTGGETAETGVSDPDWLALGIWPSAIAVHPGATFTLRVVGTDPDGARGDLPSDSGTAAFVVDDAAIATVDAAGLVTAVAEGTTTVRVTIGGLEATCAVEVRADGVLTVTVLDAATGLPIEDARVALPSIEPSRTDASGVTTIAVSDGGPVTFSAWVNDDYDALTLIDVVGRDVTVSVRPKDTDPRDATLGGSVDYGGVEDADWEDMVVGFASASIQGSLAATRLEDLFSDEREVTVFGVDLEAPSNLFVEGEVDTYEASALSGAVGLWGIAGPILIEDATSGFSGSGDALQLLADNMGDMSWGQVVGLSTSSGAETAVDFAPAEHFDDLTGVSLPPLSSGFGGDETYFVLVAEELADEGFVVTGLGTGDQGSTTDIPTVPAGTVSGSLGTTALAYAQGGGVGSGGPVATALGTMGEYGNLEFPELQDLAQIDSFDAGSRGLGVTVDTDAHLVRIRLRDPRNRVHDIVAPASWTGTIPNCVSTFGMANASVEVLALQTSEGTYESWLTEGDLDPSTKPAITAARTTQE